MNESPLLHHMHFKCNCRDPKCDKEKPVGVTSKTITAFICVLLDFCHAQTISTTQSTLEMCNLNFELAIFLSLCVIYIGQFSAIFIHIGLCTAMLSYKVFPFWIHTYLKMCHKLNALQSVPSIPLFIQQMIPPWNCTR